MLLLLLLHYLLLLLQLLLALLHLLHDLLWRAWRRASTEWICNRLRLRLRLFLNRFRRWFRFRCFLFGFVVTSILRAGG